MIACLRPWLSGPLTTPTCPQGSFQSSVLSPERRVGTAQLCEYYMSENIHKLRGVKIIVAPPASLLKIAHDAKFHVNFSQYRSNA